MPTRKMGPAGVGVAGRTRGAADGFEDTIFGGVCAHVVLRRVPLGHDSTCSPCAKVHDGHGAALKDHDSGTVEDEEGGGEQELEGQKSHTHVPQKHCDGDAAHHGMRADPPRVFIKWIFSSGSTKSQYWLSL